MGSLNHEDRLAMLGRTAKINNAPTQPNQLISHLMRQIVHGLSFWHIQSIIFT